MAYQNFFMSGKNPNRVTPAQVSGKELNGEFRMRNEGESVQIVSVRGYETSEKGKIAVFVSVHTPDGKVAFEDTFVCNK